MKYANLSDQLNEKSIAKRDKVYDVGINDADYQISKLANGENLRCPYYQRWQNMLERSFSKSYKKKYPSYTKTSCCEEWIYFSNFKKWMESKKWKNMELDKDILVKDNNLYSPDTCIFAPPELNKLAAVHRKNGSTLPGVSVTKNGDFRARTKTPTGTINLGRYKTLERAATAWLDYHKDKLRKAAKTYAWVHPDMKYRLLEIADDLSIETI